MNRSICGAVIAALFAVGTPTGASAQQAGAARIDEITVTARKREENLRDVPVSISVLGEDFIKEAGILDQYDLFEAVPGINYSQHHDRQGVRSSVRGVQSNAQNPVRAKVTSFIDGIPVLGQTGSLQFTGVDRVEVMRGPQSAAFGRSTFAGAINYITNDPGDEFEARILAATSDLDRNMVAVSLGGPITDTLGVLVDASFDEYRGSDKWFTTDGITLGSQSTDFITGKLVWTPSETFEMKLRAMHLETDDDPPLQWFIPEAAQNACTNFTLPNGRAYIKGAWNCDPTPPVGGIPQNNHPEETLTPDTFEYYLAQSFSVLEPGSYVKRDRIQGEFNVEMTNDSLIQVLVSYSEDELRRWFDADRSDSVPTFAMGMIMGVNSMANPNTIEETYAEIRWVSPGDQKVRWLVGASVFDYTFLTNIYTQLAGLKLGLEDEANNGNPFLPTQINSDDATNIGIYGNLTWDVTDRTTLSAELRFQEDDVTNISNITGDSFNNTTRSVQPRLAINHALNDNWSVYGQLASGTNPGGVNLSFLTEARQASLAAAKAAGFISFDESSFLKFVEEEIKSFEVGVKGSALENRLQLAAAVYVMKWADMIQPAGTNWYDDSWNDGTWDPDGRIFTTQETAAGGFLNVGDGDLTGIEFEANWLPTDNWRFRAAIAVAKAEYGDSCQASPVNDFGYEPTWLIEDGAPYDCYDVKGNDLIQQPDTTASLSGTYAATLGAGGWDWSARLGVTYSSREYIDVLNLAYMPSRTIINGSVSFRNESWNLTLFGNNLTDDDTPLNSMEFANDFNITPATYNFNMRPRGPREIGARLSYQF